MVDLAVPDTAGEPLELQADQTWSLQQGDRIKAYTVMHRQVGNYVREQKIDVVVIKGSAVSLGGTKKAHLEAAELRGVVAAAAATGSSVKFVSRAAVSRNFGTRKADEYLRDNDFWSGQVQGRLRSGSREAALLLIAELER